MVISISYDLGWDWDAFLGVKVRTKVRIGIIMGVKVGIYGNRVRFKIRCGTCIENCKVEKGSKRTEVETGGMVE